MFNRNIDIIIKENVEIEAGKVISTVGLRFEAGSAYFGDYEKFDGPELTDEQIIGAVQRLLTKHLPVVPKAEEEPFKTAPVGKSLGRFKRTPDGKFVKA